MKFIFRLCCWSQCSLAFQFKINSVSSEELHVSKTVLSFWRNHLQTAINFLTATIVFTKHSKDGLRRDKTTLKFSRLLLYFQYIKQILSTQTSTTVAWLDCSWIKEIKAIWCTLLEVEWERASHRVDKLKQCLCEHSRVL